MDDIVVGFDGSEESRDALVLAKQFAKAKDATLHVAFVQWDDDAVAERRRFERLFSEARRELGALGFVEQRLKEASASKALQELAEELRPSMIVLGSCHRGKVGRVMMGSVGERLLHGAPCAVAVAPRGYADREHFGLGVIGVGYDGRPESKLALGTAARLARSLDCSLRLISVVPHVVTPGRVGAAYEAIGADTFSEILEEGARSVGDGVEITIALEHGHPAEELANQGVELDLLVVGSRGYGPLRRALVGGVSADVMRLAPCPVLVTPRSSVGAGEGHFALTTGAAG